MMDPTTPEEFPLADSTASPPLDDPSGDATATPAPPTLNLTPEQLADFGLSDCAPGGKYVANLTASGGGDFVIDTVTDEGSEEGSEDVSGDLGYDEPDSRRAGRGPGAPLDFGKLRSTVS